MKNSLNLPKAVVWFSVTYLATMIIGAILYMSGHMASFPLFQYFVYLVAGINLLIHIRAFVVGARLCSKGKHKDFIALYQPMPQLVFGVVLFDIVLNLLNGLFVVVVTMSIMNGYLLNRLGKLSNGISK